MKAGVKEGDRIIKVSKRDLSPSYSGGSQELPSAVAYPYFISFLQAATGLG